VDRPRRVSRSHRRAGGRRHPAGRCAGGWAGSVRRSGPAVARSVPAEVRRHAPAPRPRGPALPSRGPAPPPRAPARRRRDSVGRPGGWAAHDSAARPRGRVAARCGPPDRAGPRVPPDRVGLRQPVVRPAGAQPCRRAAVTAASRPWSGHASLASARYGPVRYPGPTRPGGRAAKSGRGRSVARAGQGRQGPGAGGPDQVPGAAAGAAAPSGRV